MFLKNYLICVGALPAIIAPNPLSKLSCSKLSPFLQQFRVAARITQLNTLTSSSPPTLLQNCQLDFFTAVEIWRSVSGSGFFGFLVFYYRPNKFAQLTAAPLPRRNVVFCGICQRSGMLISISNICFFLTSFFCWQFQNHSLFQGEF